ncbi:MAG: hypothetical protein ACREMY_00180 [bacterium]
MAGLNLGGGAQVRVGAQANYGNLANPANSLEAGFGLGGSDGSDQGIGALSPNDPAGITFWVGLASTGLLLFLYWSLPS